MASANLSARDARRVQLAAQGFLGRRLPDAASVVTRTRGVQLDTISVLARSHELIAYARLGAVSPSGVEEAYWGGPPYRSFEYWYHAACILPIEEWPHLGFKREARRRRGFRWHRLEDPDRVCARVLSEIADRGPLTARELGGSKRKGPWWDWSETKIAAEWLLDVGDLICVERRGYQRVYDLPERVLEPGVLASEVPRPEAIRTLVARALSALGVATAADLATYVGVKRVDATAALVELAPIQVTVDGWKEPAYSLREAIENPTVWGKARSRPLLLSPFDSLACDRGRLERVFGFWHRLEAYVPRPQRVHGYYTMPVLAGDGLVARVDPSRQKSTLVARAVHLESARTTAQERRAAAATGVALAEAARWVGCDTVELEKVEPERARGAIAAALKVTPARREARRSSRGVPPGRASRAPSGSR